MTKSLEQQELISHWYFSGALTKLEIDQKCRSEIFSKKSMFHTIARIIKDERDTIFQMLLGAIKPETSMGHMVPSEVILPLLVNCLNHLEILNYKQDATFDIDQSLLSESVIDLQKVIRYLQARNKECDQRYSQLFQHINKEYRITGVRIEDLKAICRDDDLHKLNNEQQVRTQIFSALLSSHLIITGLYLISPDHHAEIQELVKSEEDIIVKAESLSHTYSNRIKFLFKVLERVKKGQEAFSEDTISLVKIYFTYLLNTLSYNEVINECFDQAGKYLSTVLWLEEEKDFALFEAVSLTLSRCKYFQLAQKGISVLESFLAKNKEELLSDQYIRHTFFMYYNIVLLHSNLKLSEEGAVYCEFLIDNYSIFQKKILCESIEQEELNSMYINIVNNLINIYCISDNKESLCTLRRKITEKNIPYNGLFKVAIDIFTDGVTTEDAKTELSKLQALFGHEDDVVITGWLQNIANFTEDRNIIRAIKRESPTEKFHQLMVNKEFDTALRIFEEYKEDIIEDNIYFYGLVVHALISLKKYEDIPRMIERVPADTHKAHAYYLASRWLNDENEGVKFALLERALSYEGTVDPELYNAIVYYGIISALRFKKEDLIATLQSKAETIDFSITSVWAKSLFNTEFQTHEELMISLLQGNHASTEEYYKLLSTLQDHTIEPIKWIIDGAVLSSMDDKVKLIAESATIKKYGYIDPKLIGKIDNIEEYETALSSGVASRPMGQDGVKWHYSKSKKARGECSGHKIKIGKDIEIYGHKIFSRIDDQGVTHQLCLFDHNGNHQDMINYFDVHPRTEIIGDICHADS